MNTNQIYQFKQNIEQIQKAPQIYLPIIQECIKQYRQESTRLLPSKFLEKSLPLNKTHAQYSKQAILISDDQQQKVVRKDNGIVKNIKILRQSIRERRYQQTVSRYNLIRRIWVCDGVRMKMTKKIKKSYKRQITIVSFNQKKHKLKIQNHSHQLQKYNRSKRRMEREKKRVHKQLYFRLDPYPQIKVDPERQALIAKQLSSKDKQIQIQLKKKLIIPNLKWQHQLCIQLQQDNQIQKKLGEGNRFKVRKYVQQGVLTLRQMTKMINQNQQAFFDFINKNYIEGLLEIQQTTRITRSKNRNSDLLKF